LLDSLLQEGVSDARMPRIIRKNVPVKVKRRPRTRSREVKEKVYSPVVNDEVLQESNLGCSTHNRTAGRIVVKTVHPSPRRKQFQSIQNTPVTRNALREDPAASSIASPFRSALPEEIENESRKRLKERKEQEVRRKQRRKLKEKWVTNMRDSIPVATLPDPPSTDEFADFMSEVTLKNVCLYIESHLKESATEEQ